MEQYIKVRIEFNSVEHIDILVDTNATSLEDVDKSLFKFMETEDYENDVWNEDDVVNWLLEDGICCIPLNIGISNTFWLPDGENK